MADTSLPFTSMLPPEGCSWPEIKRRMVVLPTPLGAHNGHDAAALNIHADVVEYDFVITLKRNVSKLDNRIFQIFVHATGLFSIGGVLLTVKCPILFHMTYCSMNLIRVKVITCWVVTFGAQKKRGRLASPSS